MILQVFGWVDVLAGGLVYGVAGERESNACEGRWLHERRGGASLNYAYQFARG